MILTELTPDAKRSTIRIGVVVRKSVDVVRACFQCLANQEIPANAEVTWHVIFDTDEPEVIHQADLFCPDATVECEEPVRGDFADDGVTHHWQGSSMARVGALKNRILQRALADRVDAVWLVDADLMCDSGTLKSLWFADNPVVSAVFWTRWMNVPDLHAAPQVWLQHPYQLQGRGYPDEVAFRRRLVSRQLTQVWGLGACTLIRRAVLEAGVSFAYIPGVSQDGMMAGEDRHFCLQCESKHIPMIADPWPHIYHAYHQSEHAQIPERLADLASVRDQVNPKWVSVKLKLLEPIPTAPGQFGLAAPHIQRFRVGANEMLPDLEAQVLQHLDGQPFIASVCYPNTYEIGWLRGQRRLIDVMVIDSKTDLPMPVLDDELRDRMDLTTYTAEQQGTM